MASLRIPALRRAAAAGLLVLAAVALLPASAGAAQPATVRLLGTDPAYRSTTVTMPDGARVVGTPGLFRLRITPLGGPAVERVGFCVDQLHTIAPGVDHAVSLRTASDDPRLSAHRYAEAGWLLQSAEGLIAAAPQAARGLEAGALQTAVWQLSDQAREVNPTSDAALNARTASLRALAARRAIGGPLTMSPAMTRGCAGRSAVVLKLTGTPGSSASLVVTSGSGVVSPATVLFAADGTAQASVSSSTAGTVAVTARAEGGALTRLARAAGSTPQETIVLVPQSYSSAVTVVFEDCPVIPLETTDPVGPAAPANPVVPLETPVAKPLDPSAPATPVTPRSPAQATPRFGVTKSGPATVRAGRRARYTITVVNRGSASLRGLTLTDALPQGMSLTSTPASARLRGGSLVWSLSPLKAGRTRTLHVTVRIDADIAGRRCNRATLTAPGGASRTASACTMISAAPRPILPAVTA